MASLLDRRDIHKGVIALENIASAFFDCAQASKSSVHSQRRLTKCLREVANVKGNPAIANTAFTASAWILDAITEVDAKFALIMEREYETLSAELRKWFKRLAKEEKDHDEYTNVRQNKIRQAGERYEKRALKRDVGEEHNRYINLLNTLGAEISEAQAAHAHSVNHRHTTVMFSIGACMSRLADASWIRTCEGVKRCAPGIGRVGEARVFCETGWLGNVPNDLADLSDPSLEHPNSLSGRLSPSDAQPWSPSRVSETQTSNSPPALVPPDPLHEAQHTEEVEPRLYSSPPRQAFISTTSRKTSPSDSRILNQSSGSTAIPEYYTSDLAMDGSSHHTVLEDPSPTALEVGGSSPGTLPNTPSSSTQVIRSADRDETSSGGANPNGGVARLRDKFDNTVHSSKGRQDDTAVFIPKPGEEERRDFLPGRHSPRAIGRTEGLEPIAGRQRNFRVSTSPYQAGGIYSSSTPYLPITDVSAIPSTSMSEVSKASWVGRGLRKLSLPVFSASPPNGPRSGPPSMSSPNSRSRNSSYERGLNPHVGGNLT